MNVLYRDLARILEVNEVKPGDVLAGFAAWDSLAVLSIIAMLDSEYGVTLHASEVEKEQMAGDLARLVESKRQAH